jgi:zinc transport system permease protein
MGEWHSVITAPEYRFFRTALLVSAVGSIPFGIIGTFVVVRRVTYLAGAVAHTAFGGIGIGLFVKQHLIAGTLTVAWLPLVGQRSPTDSPEEAFRWFDPVLFALPVAVLGALLIGTISLKSREREDTIIGAIWAIGMAVGLLFLDFTPGYYNLTSYLFGDILLISPLDLYLVMSLGALVVLLTIPTFLKLEAVCFDAEFARLRGIPDTFYFLFLLILTALSVVLMVRIVGILMVIAMLTLPPAVASRLTTRLQPMALWSVLLCLLFSWAGLLISLQWSTSSGPTMIVVAGGVYLLVLAGQWPLARWKKHRKQ